MMKGDLVKKKRDITDYMSLKPNILYVVEGIHPIHKQAKIEGIWYPVDILEVFASAALNPAAIYPDAELEYLEAHARLTKGVNVSLSCHHESAQYFGFTEQFTYCKKCDKKL